MLPEARWFEWLPVVFWSAVIFAVYYLAWHFVRAMGLLRCRAHHRSWLNDGP